MKLTCSLNKKGPFDRTWVLETILRKLLGHLRFDEIFFGLHSNLDNWKLQKYLKLTAPISGTPSVWLIKWVENRVFRVLLCCPWYLPQMLLVAPGQYCCTLSEFRICTPKKKIANLTNFTFLWPTIKCARQIFISCNG